MGCTVVLTDLSTGEQVRYVLVHPNEASLARGKISVSSPIGKALLDKAPSDVVEVVAPAGVVLYRIDAVEA
ncbi:MAG: greA [Dehalococcoidia bacterium]|nr:greA [Dehalococcoidia bacterium]